jgi:hypothetical protein
MTNTDVDAQSPQRFDHLFSVNASLHRRKPLAGALVIIFCTQAAPHATLDTFSSNCTSFLSASFTCSSIGVNAMSPAPCGAFVGGAALSNIAAAHIITPVVRTACCPLSCYLRRICLPSMLSTKVKLPGTCWVGTHNNGCTCIVKRRSPSCIYPVRSKALATLELACVLITPSCSLGIRAHVECSL